MLSSVVSRIRIAVLIGLGSVGIIALIALYKNDGSIEPSPFECEIYRTFYESVVGPDNGTISRTTRNFIPIDGSLKPPSRFESLNARHEQFQLSTSGFFGATVALPDREISGCFEGQVAFREPEQGNNAGDAGGVNNWTFSRVGTSPDGRYSLLFTRRVCGNLCAYAQFHLLENNGKRWQVVATRTEWMS